MVGFPPQGSGGAGFATLDGNSEVTSTQVRNFARYAGFVDFTTPVSGPGTITVPNKDVYFFDGGVASDRLVKFTLTGGTTGTELPPLIDLTANYLVGWYNGGAPIFTIITDPTLINNIEYIHYCTVYRSGNNLHTQEDRLVNKSLSEKLFDRFYFTERYGHESGLYLGIQNNAGTPEFMISEGVVWIGDNRITLPEMVYDSSSFFCHLDAGVWHNQYRAGNTDINNTQYQGATDLVTLTDTFYTVNHIYRGVEAQLHSYILLSTAEYATEALALASSLVTNIPALISSHADFIGRIVIQKGAVTGTIQSAFTTTFGASSGITDHNILSGKQGGTVGEYYHSTLAEYTGTGTGVFVRASTPTIATPSMTNVAITSGSITGTDVTATDLKSATTTIAIDAAVAPTAGQVLTAIDGTSASWQAGGVTSDALRNTKGGTGALASNVAGTDNSAFGYNALNLTTGTGFNTALGSYALDAVTTGVNNTAVGYNAGGAIATTNDTTCVGYNAGMAGTDNTIIGSGAGAIISGSQNTAVGKGALAANTSAVYNTAIGYNALAGANGSRNTVVGCQAMELGSGALARNTVVGYKALAAAGTNIDCTAIGYQAGLVNTTAGIGNTFVGAFTGDANTTGTRNVAVGKDALGANTTSSDCTMIGYQAGLVNTAATNTFIGSLCGDANTSGANNTALGKDALGANIIGTDCTMIGFQAGLLNTADSNIFIGSGTGDANTTGTRNIALGTNALGANSTTSDCTMIGHNTGLLNTAADNTFVGSGAGSSNTTGTSNTAIGKDALLQIATSNNCTAIGYAAGFANTAADNTFVGSGAGDANTTGTGHTALGKGALTSVVNVDNDTCIGYLAGATTTGGNNTFIGSTCDGSAAGRANAIGIGYNVSVVADSTWVIGTIGIKQAITEGANAAMGTATLVAGTIAVANTLVTANSRIFLTSQDPNAGTQGPVFVSARTAGVSFTITSTIGALDTAIVAWEIKEPN